MQVVKVSQSSTSNLFGHLEAKHPKEHAAVTPAKRSQRVVLNKPASVSSTLSTSSSSLSVPSGQRSITDMFPYDNKNQRHNTLVNSVTKNITSGCVPVYTVKKESFVDMIKVFDARFILPGRNFLPNGYSEGIQSCQVQHHGSANKHQESVLHHQ